MKRLSWKYMAGLIDGEGCIDMQGGNDNRDNGYYIRPRLRVTLTGFPGQQLITMMKDNFGGHLEFKGNQGNDKWQPAFCWCLTSKPLRAFLQNVFNHLFLKKEQAKFAIWWTDNYGGKHVSEEMRRCAKEELKAMKRDPQRLSDQAISEVQRLIR